MPAALRADAATEWAGWASLDGVLEALGGPEVMEPVPPTFEDLGVERGLVRYALDVPGPRRPYPLSVRGLRDMAVVYVDGVRAGTRSSRSRSPGPRVWSCGWSRWAG